MRNSDEIKDREQNDAPPGSGLIRWDSNGIEWFNYNGAWYQARALPPAARRAWLAEHLRLAREEKELNRLY